MRGLWLQTWRTYSNDEYTEDFLGSWLVWSGASVPQQPLMQLTARGKISGCSRAAAQHLCSQVGAALEGNPKACFDYLHHDKDVFCVWNRCSTSSRFWTTNSLHPHPTQKTCTQKGVFIRLFVQCFNLTEIQDQQEHCTPGYYYMLEHRVLHF